MRLAYSWRYLCAALFLSSVIPAAAQLPPSQPDPLARIRAAASNTPACSATGESLCEQVAPKIIANAQGESPLAESLRRLRDEARYRDRGTLAAARAVAWGIAAFRDAGVDFHTEMYTTPLPNKMGVLAEQENLVAEIRGREKPDEWVLLGAHLDSPESGTGTLDGGRNAALVVEAARDIFLTGIRPRRSIRFVLFTGEEHGMPGSWAYVRAHRAELDRARAVILLGPGISRIHGFMLNGRHDIVVGLREALKPLDSWDVSSHVIDAPLGTDSYDFLVEGVPTLVANQDGRGDHALPGTFDKAALQELKRNTAIAAVTAFAIAERAEPLGPRQSRAEIETLLKTSGLAEQMKIAGLWPLWESGERGRQP